MAPATIESSLVGHEVLTAATLLRDEDPLSQALRLGNLIGVDDIARFHRAMPPIRESCDTLPTTDSSSQPKCSSHGESTTTKPTSATTYPPITHTDNGKHKMKTGYASSLSVTYGSASEAEVALTALRRNNLIALGDWADAELETEAPLKGKIRARDRRQTRHGSRQKKPIVVIDQEIRPVKVGSVAASRKHRALTVSSVPPYGSIGARDINAHPHSTARGNEASSLVDEAQSLLTSPHDASSQPLTRARNLIIFAMVVLKVFILATSAYGAYLTGNERLPCTKGILFAAASSMAILTVLTMLIARRALAEALLAGLIEFVFGFALVVEIDDFM